MKKGVITKNQAILDALEAILGQRSAHSLATGPVIALPETHRPTHLISMQKKLSSIDTNRMK